MQCPNCKTEIPAPDRPREDEPQRDRPSRERPARAAASDPEVPRAPAPEDALRADRPPAPCPQCGWSTMWNE
jgi:hypothetical protein